MPCRAACDGYTRSFLGLISSPHTGLASIGELKIEAIKKGKIQKRGVIGVGAIIEGKIMNLSVEAKVAIAVATGFVVVIVGAMAQG